MRFNLLDHLEHIAQPKIAGPVYGRSEFAAREQRMPEYMLFYVDSVGKPVYEWYKEQDLKRAGS